MIRRLFYFWLGFFTAVWAMRRIRALHPNHVARRAVTAAAGTGVALREFAADVRHLTASREIELRARYGLDTVEDRPMLEDRRPAVLRRTRALAPGGSRHSMTNHIETHDEKDGR